MGIIGAMLFIIATVIYMCIAALRDASHRESSFELKRSKYTLWKAVFTARDALMAPYIEILNHFTPIDVREEKRIQQEIYDSLPDKSAEYEIVIPHAENNHVPFLRRYLMNYDYFTAWDQYHYKFVPEEWEYCATVRLNAYKYSLVKAGFAMLDKGYACTGMYEKGYNPKTFIPGFELNNNAELVATINQIGESQPYFDQLVAGAGSLKPARCFRDVVEQDYKISLRRHRLNIFFIFMVASIFLGFLTLIGYAVMGAL